MNKRTPFPNRAGNQPDTDEILAAELEKAGIDVERHEWHRSKGEVKTAVIGTLHGWFFARAWRYWVASGPGIELAAAERLHEAHGRSVRVAGHCGCPSPREWYRGLACGSYHVDDQEGLNALADTIRELVARADPPKPKPSWDQILRDLDLGNGRCTYVRIGDRFHSVNADKDTIVDIRWDCLGRELEAVKALMNIKS